MSLSAGPNVIQGEISAINRVNQLLRADYMCVPPYGCVTGEWLSEAFQITERNKLKYHVTKLASLPWRRAYQTTHFYHKLDIFKPFSYVLDIATMTFLEGNWVCSYLSLLPVLEGVLIKWDQESRGGEYKISKALVDSVFSEVPRYLNLEVNLDNVLKIQNDFLREILSDEFFVRGTSYMAASNKRDRYFNRNITSHMFISPKYTESGLNAVNIFLYLDIIAELYAYCRSDKFSNLMACRFNKNIYPEELDKYFALYLECANRGMDGGLINRLHNTCYTSDQILNDTF